MKEPNESELAELIEKQLDGTISDADFAFLEARLLEDAEARQLFIDLSHQHAQLHLMGDSLVEAELRSVSRPAFGKAARWAMAAAAVLAVSGLVWMMSGPKPVATLLSAEYAAWESELPTNPGAELMPGFLKLKSGVATIQFRSGVTLILEAPAHLELETPMRGRLLAGSAVIDVPEQAIGFILDTPGSYAVDHGTQFAVTVDSEEGTSTFDVLSGEISVHHSASGEVLRLSEAESVEAGEGLSQTSRREKGALPDRSSALRLGAVGEKTIIRSDEVEGKIHPDFLMAKRSSVVSGFDRRSLFLFELPVNNSAITKARLRLNLVPCGLGFASRLPEVSQFSVYGTISAWAAESVRWENAPKPADAVFLGSFEISRGQQRGSFGIESESLVNFLNQNAETEVTFLLIRDTDEAKGNGLVHAFASSSHPESSGPALEINFAESAE